MSPGWFRMAKTQDEDERRKEQFCRGWFPGKTTDYIGYVVGPSARRVS